MLARERASVRRDEVRRIVEERTELRDPLFRRQIEVRARQGATLVAYAALAWYDRAGSIMSWI